MDIREIFQFYHSQDISDRKLDLSKLKRYEKEYEERTFFSLMIFVITILWTTYFIYIVVSQGIDSRFAMGYVVLFFLFCVWLVSMIRFTKKINTLRQIISYPNYKILPAKCTYVTQMNMIGIRYELEISESPWKRCHFDALKLQNYVMDVKEGDEVCIVQFFSTYYVVFPTCKKYGTTRYNDIKSIFSISNLNKRQRRAYLGCYLIDMLLMIYILHYAVVDGNKEFPFAAVVFIVVFFIMLLLIIALRTKETQE